MANHHLGSVHSNWKFGKPTPRDARTAFGWSLDAGRHTRSDTWVFWGVLLCFVIGLLVTARWP